VLKRVAACCSECVYASSHTIMKLTFENVCQGRLKTVGPEPFECEVYMTGTCTCTHVCVCVCVGGYALQCVPECCSVLL